MFSCSLINSCGLELAGYQCAQVFNRELLREEMGVWLASSGGYQGLKGSTVGLSLYQAVADPRVFLGGSLDNLTSRPYLGSMAGQKVHPGVLSL